ncbi:LOG family protein [Saccharomonospora saliphila]|uniref:SLOG family protein n=1 Tax=Saccharomonospora saliphila TaxID=369829 RepID=UPI00037BB437|nr:SLOG family protein [Saccharomonospora saliphila]
MDHATIWRNVACTGHRPQYLPPGSQQWLSDDLARIAARLRDEHGTEIALSGGAAGVDLLWAEAAHSAGLATWLYLPFPDQDARWPQQWRDRLAAARHRADRLITLGQRYSVALLHQRNARLVADGDALVAAHDPARRSGGTVSTMRHAWDQGRPIIRVDLRHRRSTLAANRP